VPHIFKMIRLLYIGLLGQFLVSCINMNDPEDQATYIEERNNFDKSLVKLFPDRLPNNMLGFGFSAPYDNVPSGLHLTTKYFSEKDYLETKTKYQEQSKYHTSSTDKCLFLVDDYEGMKQEKCENFYPIPTEAIFDTDHYGKTKTRITDSEVFFIDTKPGDFIKDGKNHSRVDLLENWTHGYSTGITTNDNNRTIQFWLVAW
jgi:hypothetical protein